MNNYNIINQYNERNRANTLNTFAIMTNSRENNVNNYKKNNLKKMLLRNYNNRNDEDVTLTEQNESYQDNEDNSGIINESNDEPMSNTFYINTKNAFNIKKNIKVNSHNNNNNSFTFRKHIKILNPLPSVEINLEDLYLIENKYFHIIHNLGEKKEIANDCFDLFNFYYNCSFYQYLLKIFTEPNIIKFYFFYLNFLLN